MTSPSVLVPADAVSVLAAEPDVTVVAAVVEKTEVVAVVAEGPQGPPGSYNGPAIFKGPEPPSDTSLIWVRTPS